MNSLKSAWLSVILLPCLLGGKESQLSLSATHNMAFIGDRIGVTLLVKADMAIDDFSAVLETEKAICELVKEGGVSKRVVPEGVVLEQKFELSFFDLGDYTIGPARVTLFSRGEKLAELSTNEVPIMIKSLLKEDAAELEPGKPPLLMSGSPLYLLQILWFPSVIMAFLLGIWLLSKKRRKKGVSRSITLTPLQVLEKELGRLFDERLFEKGFMVLFFLRLTQSLKKFLHGWHGIDAEEMTTEELRQKLDALANVPLRGASLIRIFENADLVKFARHELVQSEYDEICRLTKMIVGIYREEERLRVAESLRAREARV